MMIDDLAEDPKETCPRGCLSDSIHLVRVVETNDAHRICSNCEHRWVKGHGDPRTDEEGGDVVLALANGNFLRLTLYGNEFFGLFVEDKDHNEIFRIGEAEIKSRNMAPYALLSIFGAAGKTPGLDPLRSSREFAQTVFDRAKSTGMTWHIYRKQDGVRVSALFLPQDYFGRHIRFEPNGRVTTHEVKFGDSVWAEVDLAGAATFMIERMSKI